MLLSSDCLIHTLRGSRTVGNIYGTVTPEYGFCWNENRITINRFVVRSSTELPAIEIEIDDGSRIFCDTETKILTLDGKSSYPISLNSGSSLLPLYFKETGGQDLYREPGNWFKYSNVPTDSRRWRKISRMVAEWILKRRLEQGEKVTHIDGDKKNYLPDNLRIKYATPTKRRRVKNFAEPLIAAQEFIKEIENDPRQRIKLPKKRRNHKIIQASLTVSRDLFSIKTFDSVNLAVSGIFVSE